VTEPSPDPPSDLLRRPLPLRQLAAGSPLFRLHPLARGPVFFGPAGTAPRWRFDDPQGEFKVCYLGLEPEAALVETLLREPWHRRALSWSRDIEGQRLAEFNVTAALRLVDFGGPGLRALGTTLEVLGTRDYALPRVWSRALWSHPDAPDGIVYPCRHDNRASALALFDRAAHALSFIVSRSFDREAGWRWLAEMSARYQFGLLP
jgi:hypothetical protein